MVTYLSECLNRVIPSSKKAEKPQEIEEKPEEIEEKPEEIEEKESEESHDFVFPDGSHVFWLPDAIDVPARHFLEARLLNAWIPHTFYSVFSDNDTLALRFFPPGDPSGRLEIITLPHGNRSIDELIEFVNPSLLYTFEMVYSPATNKVTLVSDHIAEVVVDAATTCSSLLGLAPGDTSSDGQLEAPRGVDLTRTSSIFLRTSLHTSNRDPITRRTSNVLAKIPLTSQFNELEHYTTDAWVECKNMAVSFIVCRLEDDNGRFLDLNGSRRTLEVDNSELQLELEGLSNQLAEAEANLSDLELDLDGLSNDVWVDQARQDLDLATACNEIWLDQDRQDAALAQLESACNDLFADQAAQNDLIAALSNQVAAVDVTGYIPQTEKARFIVDVLEPKAIGAHDDNPGRIDVFGTLRVPFANLFDLGEPSNPWRHVYASQATLSNPDLLTFTSFLGQDGDYTLSELLNSAAESSAHLDLADAEGGKKAIVGRDATTLDVGSSNDPWRNVVADSVWTATLREATFGQGITVKGDLKPFDVNPGFPPLARVGNSTSPFLEGHFGAVYADNLFANDSGGTSRRVLLEGDSVSYSVDWEDVLNKPTIPTIPAWVDTNQNTVPLSGFDNDLVLTADSIEWANVLNKPTFFSGSYTDLEDTPTIPSIPAWVATNQNTVPLSGFDNDLVLTADSVEWANVLNPPTLFSGSYTDLTNKPTIPTIPAWVDANQNTVPLSGFDNDLVLTADSVEWANVLNKPTFFSGSYNDLADTPTIPTIPAWVDANQNTVPLSGFDNDLVLTADSIEWANVLNKPTFFSGNYDDLTNKPTIPSLAGYATEAWVTSQGFGSGSDWDTLANRPSWTDKFVYTQNVGPQMFPVETSNFDIVALDSITPTSNMGYNLGQDQLRWLFLYAKTGRFSDVVEIGSVTDRVRLAYDAESNLMTLDRPLTLSRTPELPAEAASKGYVDSAVAAATPATDWASITGATKPLINLDGGDMRVGESLVPTLDETWDLGSSSNSFRDVYTQFLTASGGAYIGSLQTPVLNVTNVMSLNGNKITQVGAPTTGTDVVNKSYVDTAVAAVSNPSGPADLSSVEAAKFMRVVNNYGEYSISPNYDYLATVDPSAFANIIFGGNYSADTGEEDRSLLGSLLGITASDFTDLKFVTGGVEVSGNIVPNNNQSHDLGSETHEWDHIFVKDVEVSDDVKVRNDVRFMVDGANVCRLKTHPDGCEVDGDMFPDGTETFSLGKIDKVWDKIYAKNTYSTTIDSAQSYAQNVYATVAATVNTLSVLAAADFGNNTLTGVASPTNSSDAMTKGYADANYLSLSGTINTNITVPAQSVIETNPTHPSANQLVTKKITEDRYSPKNHDHDGTYAELAVLNWISEFLSEMAAATTHGNLAASSDGTFATASFDIPNTIRFKISSVLLAQNVQTVDSVRLTVRMFHSATGVYITSADQELSLSFDQATNTILASQTGSLSFGASTSLVGDLSLKIVIDARIAGFRRPVMTAHAQGQWTSPTVLRVDL
eukprot:jgi/Tetstr1/432580/TSEL_021950.t1